MAFSFSSDLKRFLRGLATYYTIQKHSTSCKESNARRIMIIRQLKVNLDTFLEPDVIFSSLRHNLSVLQIKVPEKFLWLFRLSPRSKTFFSNKRSKNQKVPQAGKKHIWLYNVSRFPLSYRMTVIRRAFDS